MKKSLFLSLTFIFLFSCKKQENLPKKATGKTNTISVIIDDQLWNGEVGDRIRNKFASPVIGLPQEEPLFTINQYPAKLMEGFMTDSRTIIVVKRKNTTQFQIKKNQYAYPQNVFHISGKTNTAILEIIEKKAPQIIQIIKKAEIEETQRNNNVSLINTNKIKDKFQMDLQVPTGYKYVIENKNFIWLKKDIINGNTSVLLYQVPIESLNKTKNPINAIVRMRDSIGSLYIRGAEQDAQMITDDGYAPYLFKTKLCGKYTYETRGTWELKNDFMSGPFVNYAIVDKSHNRILVLEGFCYSPSKEVRDLMHELEAILKSVKIETN